MTHRFHRNCLTDKLIKIAKVDKQTDSLQQTQAHDTSLLNEIKMKLDHVLTREQSE
jgi:hypothetical protein